MRDIIGKRNWFFAFSLVLIVPGLIFIILGPLTGGKAGLQFSIDYTGGAVGQGAEEDEDEAGEEEERREGEEPAALADDVTHGIAPPPGGRAARRGRR